MPQPLSVWSVEGGCGAGVGKQRPLGSILQPSSPQRARRVLQSWLRRLSPAGSRPHSCRELLSAARGPAAQTHGVAQMATRRRRIVVRRKELVIMVGSLEENSVTFEQGQL